MGHPLWLLADEHLNNSKGKEKKSIVPFTVGSIVLSLRYELSNRYSVALVK